MRLAYPRSFSGLLLAGFAVVILPLLLGLGYTGFEQARLSARTQEVIAITVRVTRATRALGAELAALQRAAGQYYVLQDAQLRLGMQRAHLDVVRALLGLRGLPFPADDARRIERFAVDEAALYARLDAPANHGLVRFETFAPAFSALAVQSAAITREGNVMVDAQAAALATRARALRTVLLWQAASAVLLSVLFAALFSWLLTRPVRRIDQAIRRLGAGDLGRQPPVQGPVDLVQLGEQVDWLRQRMRDLDEQKARFLRHVSHELKTPLASLREGVELLADGVGGRLSAQQREIIQIMRGNARDLQQRIESLIGYSRVQRGLDPLSTAGVDLGALLDAIVRRNDLALRAKRVQVRRSGDAARIRADAGKLDTLFENLVINAIRFSPVGGVVEIVVRADDTGVDVTVRDDGPGVDAGDREHLFEPFFQGRRQPPAAAPGSGLGLAIAREYARMHGGDIVLSDSEVGALFRVTMPRTDADDDAACASLHQEEQGHGQNA